MVLGEELPDTSGNQEDCDQPLCLVHALNCFMDCGKYPTSCEWFLSVGFFGFCKHPDAEELAEIASLMAMYQAKETGRNQIRFFNIGN